MDRRVDPRFAPPSPDWRERLERRRRRSWRTEIYLAALHIVGVVLIAQALPDLEWWRLGMLSGGIALIARGVGGEN